MYKVTHDLTINTSLGRFGFMEGQYELSSTTVFPKQWEFYFADHSTPCFSQTFIGSGFLTIFIVMSVALICCHLRKQRQRAEQGAAANP
jgi:hypothetical protein